MRKEVIDIRNFDFNDIYFSPDYYSVFEGEKEGKFEYFLFEENKKIAYYPFFKKPISFFQNPNQIEYFDIQGAYGYNGVMSNSNSQTFINNFYKEFDNYCKINNIIAEFTRFHPLLENHKFSQSHLSLIKNRETVSVDLTKDYNDIWQSEYSSNNRNMIRKAQKLGYTTEFISSPTKHEIDIFINIYISTMKKINADEYYFFDKDFFYRTFYMLKDHAYLINVINDETQVICSSIFLIYNNFFHYHLSGRSEASDNSVNNFLIDEAVKFAQYKKCTQLHLGGGTTDDPKDSLLKFKSNFSKKKLPFYIGKKIHNPDIYKHLVLEWEKRNPEKKEKYKHILLKYRF